jgi:hypothetical protein
LPASSGSYLAEDGIGRVVHIDLYEYDTKQRRAGAPSGWLIQFQFNAYRDVGRHRYGKRWPLVQDIPLDEFKDRFLQLLEDAHRALEQVTEDDLEQWT